MSDSLALSLRHSYTAGYKCTQKTHIHQHTHPARGSLLSFCIILSPVMWAAVLFSLESSFNPPIQTAINHELRVASLHKSITLLWNSVHSGSNTRPPADSRKRRSIHTFSSSLREKKIIMYESSKSQTSVCLLSNRCLHICISTCLHYHVHAGKQQCWSESNQTVTDSAASSHRPPSRKNTALPDIAISSKWPSSNPPFLPSPRGREELHV